MKRLALCYAALGLPLFIACSDRNQPMDSATSRPVSNTIASQDTVGSTAVSSGGRSIAHAMTLPNASCIVNPTGQPTLTGQFLADAKGVVRFYVPSSRWGTQLSLDCTSPTTGQQASYTVDLTSSAAFSATDPPAPSTILPALPGDPTSYTDNELIALGYPPRGGKDTTDAMYAKWLAAVSSTTTVVDPYPITNLDKSNYATYSIVDSYPWSGLALNGGEQYSLVNADIQVPYNYDSFPELASEASIWTGLGGYNGDEALIQSGVEFDYGALTGWDLTTWIEYWTNGNHSLGLSVSSGDQLFVSCWPCDSDGARDPSGSWGACYMKDTTTGNAVGPTILSAPHTFTGTTAEWVIEVHPDNYLTDYYIAYAQGSGYDNSGGAHNFDTDQFIELWLYSQSGDELMSYAFPDSGNGTEFAWSYYGP